MCDTALVSHRLLLTCFVLLSMVSAACAGSVSRQPAPEPTAAPEVSTALPTSTPLVVEVTREVEVTRLVEVERLVVVTVVVSSTPKPTSQPTSSDSLPTFSWSSLRRPDYSPQHPVWQDRGAILFLSDNPERPGFWVMDPDGSNRRYIGDSGELETEYRNMRHQETYSPGGECRVSSLGGQDRRSGIDLSCLVSYGSPDDEQYEFLGCDPIPDLSRASYDPVWSPAGSYLAFVSQHAGSHDIWVASTCHYGSTPRKYSRNLTADDRGSAQHPSWSPDGAHLVFWSDRDGPKQLYIVDRGMDAIARISHTAWDEYDPLWIK